MNKDNAKDFLPLVQALADGKIIQYEMQIGWIDIGITKSIYFNDAPEKYRGKPEPEYPVTRLTKDELCEIYAPEETQYRGFVALANAAIKQAILDGDVILPEKK